MRAIDADALIKIIENTYMEGDSKLSFRVDGATEDTLIGKFQTIDIISDMPTVDVLDKIRDEIERLHCHPKLDFIKNDEVVEMALEIIDKYR